MDPLKEIGRKQKVMDKGAYQDALNRPIDAIQQSTPYRLADLIMNGEDADIGMAESLIPTVSLQKKLAQGKLPGLADIMDIPNPLSAMAPIGYGLKELRAGARLGKTLRNIEKAKEARDFVHRIHRTHVKDANSIEDKGLLVGKDNPNYSRNTGDTHLYPPSVWMGVDPTNVPVMQHYFTQQGDKGIDKTRTFSVRIPRDVYNQSPRIKWEGGRSGTPLMVWGKGNPSLSPETARWTGNQAKIDMMVGSIPKEWLSMIPQKRIHELVNNRLAREKLEREIQKFYGYGTAIPRPIMDNTRLQITSGDELANKLTFDERKAFNTNTELEQALDEETRLAKIPQKLGLSDFADSQKMTPYGILSNALGRLGDKIISNNWIPPYGTTMEDVIKGNIAPAGGIRASEINPAMGAVTKGMMKPGDIAPKDRMFDWDKYKEALEYDESPWEATIQAQPQYVMNPDVAIMFEPNENKKTASLGSISRAVMSGDIPDSWTGKLKALSEEMAEDKSGSLRDATEKSFEDLFRFYAPGDLDESTVLEVIGKSKSPTLSRLRDLNPEFRTKPGAIGRGNVDFTPEPLQDYYKDLVESGWADDWWWADPDDPADVAAVARRIKQDAGEKLREVMQNNAEYDGNVYTGGTPLINPFKHLRDVSTPK